MLIEEDENRFEVHVHIHKAKHLVDKDGIRREDGVPFIYTDQNGRPDPAKKFNAWPVVQVECMNEVRWTEIVENTDQPTFDKHFVFKAVYDSISPEKIFAEELIKFKYYDASTWRRDLVLGEYGLQVHSVLTDEKAMPTASATRSLLQTRLNGRYGTTLNAWLAMHQPLQMSSVADKVRGAGFIQVSVTVLCNNQGGLQKALPTPVPKTDIQNFLSAPYIMPPPKVMINTRRTGMGTKHLEMIPHLFELVVRIYKAELPADVFNASEGHKPYIRVLFNGHGNSHDSSIQLEDWQSGMTTGKYGGPGQRNTRGIGVDTEEAENQGTAPVWNQECRIPFHKYDRYTVLENLALQLRDGSNDVDPRASHYGEANYDDFEEHSQGMIPDHLVATARMSTKNLMTEPKGGWMQIKDSGPLGVNKSGTAIQKTGRVLPAATWCNFYGSKFTGMQSLREGQMNEGCPGILPTHFRGRVLAQMYVEFVGPRDVDLSADVLLGKEFMGPERAAFDTETRIKIVVKLPHERKLADGSTRRVTVSCNITNTEEQILAAFNKQHKYYIPQHFLELFDADKNMRVTELSTEEQVTNYTSEGKSSLEIRWGHTNLIELKVQFPWSATKIETLYADKVEDNVEAVMERLQYKVGIPMDKFDLYFAHEPLAPERMIDDFSDGYQLIMFWKKSLSKINVQEAEMNIAIYNRPSVYTLRFDLFMGMNFPETTKKGYELFVKVMIGNETFLKPQSDSKKVLRTQDGLRNYCEWGESFEHNWLKLPGSQDELPKLFIYVCKRRVKDNTIEGEDGRTADTLGFICLDVSNGKFPFNNRDPIWMHLEPDRLSPAYNQQLCSAGQPKQVGALQFRVQFGAREEGSRHVVRNTKTVTGAGPNRMGGAASPFSIGTQKSTETLGDVARLYSGQNSNFTEVMKDMIVSNQLLISAQVEEAIVDGMCNAQPPIKVEYPGTGSVALSHSKRHDVLRAFQEEFAEMCNAQQSGAARRGVVDPMQQKVREIMNTNRGMRMLDGVELMYNMVLTVPKASIPQQIKLVMPNTHSFELRAYIYQARDLPVQNDLLPDPYVEIMLGARRIRSTSVKKSAYPVFNQVLRMDDCELNLDPTATDHEFRKAINDYSRFAEFITVRIRDDDPLVKDFDIARFEVRLAEVDIVRASDYDRWELIQQSIEIEHLAAVQQQYDLRQSPDAPPPNWTLQSLQAYLGMRKRPYSSQKEQTYVVNGEVKLLEPRRQYPPVATGDDWWPCVPYVDANGKAVPIRDEEQDMLSKRELATRAQGQLLIWIQLLHNGPSRRNRQSTQTEPTSTTQMRIADDHGIDNNRMLDLTNGGGSRKLETMFITEKEFLHPQNGEQLDDMTVEAKRAWYENLPMKKKPVDDNIPAHLHVGEHTQYYRQPLHDQSVASLVQMPPLNRIAPASVNCMVEYRVWSCAEMMPLQGARVEHVFVEIDAGDQNDITKRMRTKKYNTEEGCFEGANAYIKESQRVQLKIPENPLFCPTLQIRVMDFRNGGTNKVLVGTASVPLVRFLPDTWKNGRHRLSPHERVSYLQDWRLKAPLYRRKDVMEEVMRKMPLAKDAMHAEIRADTGRYQFYFIQVGQDFLDPSMFDTKSQHSQYAANFKRKMRSAQIKYMANWESRQQEDNQQMKEMMGDENFKEYLEKKGVKRAFGAFQSLEGNPDLQTLEMDKVFGTTNPVSMYYQGSFDVGEGALAPHNMEIGGIRGNTMIPGNMGIAQMGDQRDNMQLLEQVENSHSAYTSLKPGDLYGPNTKFDPSTGFPINQKTGYAYDPIQGMDIDPITKHYLDKKTNLPIDPQNGFCYNRFTGKIFDPESGRAVIFNHRHHQVTMDKEMVEDYQQQIMPEGVGDDGSKLTRINAYDADNTMLMGHRRIFKCLEEDRMFLQMVPFDSIDLHRGARGAPQCMKTYAGKLKFSATIIETARRHEDPSKFRFPHRNIYSVRCYLLNGYDIMGSVNRGRTQEQRLVETGGTEDSSTFIKKLTNEMEHVSDTMPMDGDHSNLYVRVRIGNLIYYDRPINADNDDGSEMEGLINVHWKTSNPNFYCCIDCDVMLPGQSDMYIEVWDHPLREEDPSKPMSPLLNHKSKKNHSISHGSGMGLHMANRTHDRLVGSTKIDLQDRRPFTAQMNQRPIELRKLWSPTSNHAQGQLECIIDVLPSEQAAFQMPMQIQNLCPQPKPFELRMIVWTIKEIDFRGEHFRNMITTRPTDHLNLPSAQLMLRRNIKDFYLRAVFKACDMNRAPNYLWRQSQCSDTHFNVRADSDDGFYLHQEVMAINPNGGPGGQPEKATITRRYGTLGKDIDRYDVHFRSDDSTATYVGPNGEEKAGKRMRILAAESKTVKKAQAIINWRFNWKVNLPCNEPQVQVSLRDRNDKDKWCQRTLDLTKLFCCARLTMKAVCTERAQVQSQDPKKYVSGQGMVRRKAHSHDQYESTGFCGPNAVMIHMKHDNYAGNQATMWCSFEVLPEADSYVRRAGLGRNHPNALNCGYIATPENRYWECCTSCCQDFWYRYRWPILGLCVLMVAAIIMAVATANGGVM